MLHANGGFGVIGDVMVKKRGRKRQRPMENPSEETPTSYQNAMVGGVSLDGRPENEGKGPRRIFSRYVARMPEEGFQEFKAALEMEVAATFSKLPARTRKIVIVDGSRALWNYVKGCPLYKRCLALVDYRHVTARVGSGNGRRRF